MLIVTAFWRLRGVRIEKIDKVSRKAGSAVAVVVVKSEYVDLCLHLCADLASAGHSVLNSKFQNSIR